ncbi:PREDICTED: DNA polymerase V [Ceratosolen solmsi marchali]|uniref:DNA polymerase V n=1 Tax=Ceratosolen solmsi marchali TaxID=326594 RepID=A0AAJ6YCT6_9HYME|nr:PREDICTED: DNA polymerase V [Ceratosolen solmsi marchali]
MGLTLLECFPKLLKDNTSERVDGGLMLLQHLSKEVQENGESKEFNHILNRLVRGLGSNKISSRKGFYCTLTVYLLLNPSTKIDKIISIMDNELKTSASSSKSEFADINNGRILACGSIIRSNILKTSSVDEQKRILECLLHCGKQRSYLRFESVSFLIEFLNQLDNNDSLAPIWMLIEQEICKPVAEQTLDTFYALLIIQDKFPEIISKKILKNCFGSEDIINEESIKDILKILTNLPRIICYKHPIYEVFCEKLIATKFVEEFWLGIDQRFIKPSKTDEYLGVELLNLILKSTTNKSIIPTLLSHNFLKYMLKRFSNNARHKVDDVAIGFKKALSQIVKLLEVKELKAKLQISVLKKLILYPGDLMIEKITGTKVLQMIISNLNADGIKKLANLYREIAANTKFKDKFNSTQEPWTKCERIYAVQLLSVKLMHHPEIISDLEWRVEQLKFLFNLGLCEVSTVSTELAPHFKESFYRALDNKLPKLDDLRTVLTSLISHIDENVFKNSEMKLKVPLNDDGTEAWNKMIKFVKKLEKNSKIYQNINVVFHIMDLHMGLQLFSDPEMAVSSINELHSCFEHLKSQKKLNKKNDTVTENTNEPEWIEVVVDLFLSLLSRKSHLLRSLVGCVFPHICPYLTLTAIHQILSILDVKSTKNPLTSSMDGDESDSELESNADDDDEDDDEDEDEDEDGDGKNVNEDEEKNENSNNRESEEVEEESDSDIEESDVEDEAVTDRLRLAVRQALGDATMQTDTEDIDVDNIDEEEGKRLDESLAAAFKILKENRKSRTKKQEKNAQVLTHFRIRVIDLLENYLETSPSMALALDMLLPLFALLEFTIKDPHQKPLENRVRSCLKKLSAIKKFKSVEDVNEELLTTLLKALIEKGERSASICQEMGDKLAECSIFLVRCSQQTNINNDSFIQIFAENLTAFFKKRDCILPPILFKSLLQLCWVGNWNLVPFLVNFSFDNSIRFYRRRQALEFLKVFYSNIRMIIADEQKDKRRIIESNLYRLAINELQINSKQNTENGKITTNVGKEIRQKYICNLFTLLSTIHVHHIPESWDWTKIGESIANYRSTVTLAKDAKSAYYKLAHRIGAPVIPPNTRNLEKTKLNNGNQECEEEKDASGSNECLDNSESNSLDKLLRNNNKKRKKNNSHNKDRQKLKKEARELRAKLMSEGLESFDFSTCNTPNGICNNSVTNGKLDKTEDQPEIVKNKRANLNTLDVPSKKKKKDIQSGD